MVGHNCCPVNAEGIYAGYYTGVFEPDLEKGKNAGKTLHDKEQKIAYEIQEMKYGF